VPDVLRVRHTLIGEATVVHVVGEIDAIMAPTLEREVRRACAQAGPGTLVVLDLSKVNFLASAGLAVLASAQRSCRAQGRPSRVVAPHRDVLRPLALEGLDEMLDIVPSLAHALGTARSADGAPTDRKTDGDTHRPGTTGNGN
jgi:anti-sigma B factor antagonist